MKKIIFLIMTIISLVLTFVIAENFSIYHFNGSLPTKLTSIYLIAMFLIIEFSLLSIILIINKIKNKTK